MIDVSAFLHGLHEQLFGQAKRHPTLHTTLHESLLMGEVLAQLMETRHALERCRAAATAHKPRGDAGASPPTVPLDELGRSSGAVPA